MQHFASLLTPFCRIFLFLLFPSSFLHLVFASIERIFILHLINILDDIICHAALNEALTAEIQRLKLATGEITEAHLSKGMNQQVSLNPQMFQLQQLQSQQQHHHQSTQIPLYQLQPQQQTDATAKLESNK